MSSIVPPPFQSRQDLLARLQYLGQMVSTETALFHQKVAESAGMGITDLKAISTLIQEGPMTAGQISARLSLTTGAVTNLVDRLASRQIVKRTADPNDRRKVIIRVDDKVLMQGSKTYKSIGKTYQKLLDNYSVTELQLLVAYHEQQLMIIRQEITKITASKNNEWG